MAPIQPRKSLLRLAARTALQAITEAMESRLELARRQLVLALAEND